VPLEFRGRSQKSEKKNTNKKIVEIRDQHYLKKKAVIRILSVELLNTVILPVVLVVCLDNFNALFGVPWV
jgi:hypothetical protein